MISVRRVLAVVLGLAITGAIVGALLGVVTLMSFVSLRDGLRLAMNQQVVAVGAMGGSALGLILAPIAAFALMRHVSIGLAIMITALGTLVGAFIGMFVEFPGPIVGGVVGFLLAAIALRVFRKPTPRAMRLEDDAGI